jgi:hypothetical protein
VGSLRQGGGWHAGPEGLLQIHKRLDDSSDYKEALEENNLQPVVNFTIACIVQHPDDRASTSVTNPRLNIEQPSEYVDE